MTTGGEPAAASAGPRSRSQPVSPGRLTSSRTTSGRSPRRARRRLLGGRRLVDLEALARAGGGRRCAAGSRRPRRGARDRAGSVIGQPLDRRGRRRSRRRPERHDADARARARARLRRLEQLLRRSAGCRARRVAAPPEATSAIALRTSSSSCSSVLATGPSAPSDGLCPWPEHCTRPQEDTSRPARESL